MGTVGEKLRQARERESLSIRDASDRTKIRTDHIEALEAGNYAVRSSIDGQIELQRLQTRFNTMTAELEKTLQALQQERDSINHLLGARRELFTEVSHELRTPAATLRAYLDSSLMNWENKPAATLRQDLEVMSHEIDRLQVCSTIYFC